MSKTALYRKYRSRSLDDLVGQDHITTTLSNALEADKISHAYLFTGPHGVGKTSTARIIAYAVNKLEYDESGPLPIDIIEIDAASNRRIDEIRDLRETIHIAPTELRYKVYIIDEVHMLTKEAFNALLKTLEEPPEHALFILATTEAHKLPPTIISRTQQYVFRPISEEKMVKHLAYIASEENIDIDPAALQIIAEHSRGSFRDAISLLDQISTSTDKHIKAKHVKNSLGVIDDHAMTVIHQAVEERKISILFSTLDELFSQGVTAASLALQYAKHLRQLLKTNQLSSDALDDTLGLIDDLLKVQRSSHPELQLEIILTKAAVHGRRPPITDNSKNENQSSKSKASTNIAHNKPEPSSKTTSPKKSSETSSKPDNQSKTSKDMPQNTESWDDVLSYAKQHHSGLYAALRQANPVIEKNTIRLEFRFALHQRKAKRGGNYDALKEIVQATYGHSNVELQHNPSLNKAPAETSSPVVSEQPDTITEVNNVLGGEIVNLA